MQPQDEDGGQNGSIPRKPRMYENSWISGSSWYLRRKGQKFVPLRLDLNEGRVVTGPFAVPIFGRCTAAGVRTEGAGVFRIVRFVR